MNLSNLVRPSTPVSAPSSSPGSMLPVPDQYPQHQYYQHHQAERSQGHREHRLSSPQERVAAEDIEHPTYSPREQLDRGQHHSNDISDRRENVVSSFGGGDHSDTRKYPAMVQRAQEQRQRASPSSPSRQQPNSPFHPQQQQQKPQGYADKQHELQHHQVRQAPENQSLQQVVHPHPHSLNIPPSSFQPQLSPSPQDSAHGPEAFALPYNHPTRSPVAQASSNQLYAAVSRNAISDIGTVTGEANQKNDDGNANSHATSLHVGESAPAAAESPLTASASAGAFPLPAASLQWSRSSLRHEIVSSDSLASLGPTSVMTHAFTKVNANASGPHPPLSSQPISPSVSASCSVSACSPSATRAPFFSSLRSPVVQASAQPTNLSTVAPISSPLSRNRDRLQQDRNEESGHLESRSCRFNAGAASSSSSSFSASVSASASYAFDQSMETDTGSTFATDTGQRRGSTRSVLKTEEDQEVPREAVAGAAGQRGHSSIMGAGAYHARETAAGTAATGGEGEGEVEGGGGRGEAALAGSGAASSRHPFTSGSSINNNIKNNIGSDHPHHRHYSPQPPTSSSGQEYPRQLQQEQQQQQHPYPHHHHHSALHNFTYPLDPANQSYRKKMPDGVTSTSSLPSSTALTPLFSAGTPDPTASHSPSSPTSSSMNNHPLPFDPNGQSPHYHHHHHPFHNSNNTNSPGIGNIPSLNNKRRSLADLLFVPAKTIKIKEKRNSSSASSASSVESYRHDEGMENHSGPAWTSNHPKSASGTSTSSTSSNNASAPSQRMSMESQASPPTRKLSTAKSLGKGAGSSTSSPKTFQCTGYPGCNMVFTRSEHLARHERKHTGEKPYKCIVANCPRTFSRYDNMIQHTQTHGDRSKRDSLVATAVVAAATGVRSRSSSVHSTPLLSGRPRGGSSPGVFGPVYDDPHHRSLQSSPASGSPYIAGPSFAQQQQHRHPYAPHYQQHPHNQQPQHPHQQHHHPMQWTFPSGAPATSSSASLNGRGNNYSSSHIYSGDSQAYLAGGSSGPSTPVVRTLKANSRSLPHLQPRSSQGNSFSAAADSPSVGLQHGISGMEIEELKRRKSEVLLPSYAGARAAGSSGLSGRGGTQGIGLGMASFAPALSSGPASAGSHPQPLPHAEKLSPQEQERLTEHRRSAQAMLQVSTSTGLMDQRAAPGHQDQQPATLSAVQPGPNSGGYGSSNQSGNTGKALSQVQHLSASEKDRLLEHRKSTPELMYDARSAKRSSNDPTDMIVQPLPSRDSRSGVQWFSQVSTPVLSSPRDVQAQAQTQVESKSVGAAGSSRGEGGESSTVLPPILGRHDDIQSRDDRQPRPRVHSYHIHPLSRPSSSQLGLSNEETAATEGGSGSGEQYHFDPSMSPTLERHLEDRYYPIRKPEVLDVIERMETREFLGLKGQVAESYANDQFRNPEFLSNMTAVLCVIRAPHPSWKNPGPRLLSKDTDMVDASCKHDATEALRRGSSEAMDLDVQITALSHKEDLRQAPDRRGSNDKEVLLIEQPCSYALDIDMESFSRDPEPDLRTIEGLTINSLFPTKSFVAGFEPVMDSKSREANNEDDDESPRSAHGYPSNARLGRFYLPERAYRTPESLKFQPDPNGTWICCRFEEYQGVSVWVLESVLTKYQEIAQRHNMALTLVGSGPIPHRVAAYDRDEWEIQAEEQYDLKVSDLVLYPEMVQQVWRDMHQHYHRLSQQQHHHHQQQQHPHRYPQQPQQRQQHLASIHQAYPPHMVNRVATYEEYQRSISLSQASTGDLQSRRESYSQGSLSNQQQHQLPQAHHPLHGSSGSDDYERPYSNEYRQQHSHYGQYPPQSMMHHREDLSSAPSSPNSHHDHDHDQDQDDFQEDNQTTDSASSTPQRDQYYLHSQQQQSSSSYSSTLGVNAATGAGANMHRRISIAELCNPMQSLATERDRYRERDS